VLVCVLVSECVFVSVRARARMRVCECVYECVRVSVCARARTHTHKHTHTHGGSRTNRFVQVSDISAYTRVSNICRDTNYAYGDLRNFTQSFQASTDIVQSERRVLSV